MIDLNRCSAIVTDHLVMGVPKRVSTINDNRNLRRLRSASICDGHNV
jgi:hypothetical protein